MKTIVDDPEGFFESGGWSFLDPESDGDDDDDDDSEEDENFEVSGSDEASDYSDSDEDFSEDSNISDEENYSEELDSDESSGKDWSDLEAEAAEDDKNRRDSFCQCCGSGPDLSDPYVCLFLPLGPPGSGFGSIGQKHGSADLDPDPHQNVMDPQHYILGYFLSFIGLRRGFLEEIVWSMTAYCIR